VRVPLCAHARHPIFLWLSYHFARIISSHIEGILTNHPEPDHYEQVGQFSRRRVVSHRTQGCPKIRLRPYATAVLSQIRSACYGRTAVVLPNPSFITVLPIYPLCLVGYLSHDCHSHAQSSDNIWDACCICVKTALAASGVIPSDIAGIGFDATCSLVVVDGKE